MLSMYKVLGQIPRATKEQDKSKRLAEGKRRREKISGVLIKEGCVRESIPDPKYLRVPVSTPPTSAHTHWCAASW